ncbi:MAG: hypothetical protein Q9160_002697 [Pyrenula sp. 1 TL-2023]
MAAEPHDPNISKDMEIPCSYLKLPRELHSKIIEFLRGDGRRKAHLIRLSSVSRLFRYMILPTLYHDISVCGYGERTFKHLSRISSCPTPLEHTRRLGFHMEACSDKYLARIIPLLRDALAKLQALQVFTFSVHDNTELRDALKGIRLPLVKTLNVGPFGAFDMGHCPPITRVDSCCLSESKPRRPSRVELAETAAISGSPPKTLEEFYQDWSTDLITSLGFSMPALEGLFMHLRWPTSISCFARPLWRLLNLRYLVSPNVDYLTDTDVDSRATSPNKPDLEAKITQTLFRECQQLTELWLGWGNDVTIAYMSRRKDSDEKSMDHGRIVPCARGKVVMKTFRHSDVRLKHWRANHSHWRIERSRRK